MRLKGVSPMACHSNESLIFFSWWRTAGSRSGNPQAEVPSPLASLCAGFALWLLAFFAVASPAAAQQSLTPRQIAARTKPAVVMIETDNSIDVKVPSWVLPKESLVKLLAIAKEKAKKKEIGETVDSLAHEMMQQLADNPKNFFYVTRGYEFDKTVQINFTGSGSILTPDGYIVTNAHVIQTSNEELYPRLVDNMLKELFPKDLPKFQELFNSLDTRMTEDDQQLVLTALKKYYLAAISVGQPQRKIYVQIGLALPGLDPMAHAVIADVLQSGQGEPTPGKDVSIIKIEQKNLPTIPIGDDSKIQQGDRIHVIGFPGAAEISRESQGVESTITSGEIGKRVKMPGGWYAMQTEAAISGGNSGGPAVNDQGEIIGLATFTIHDPQTGAQVPGLGYLVPVNIVNQFLNQSGVKPQESSTTHLYNSALTDLDAKNCSRALDEFRQLKEANPGLPFVQEHIQEAISCKPATAAPTAYLIPAGIAAAVIALAAILFLALRKPKLVAERVNPELLQQPMMRGQQQMPQQAAALPMPPRTFGSIQGTGGSVAGKRFELTKQGLLIGRDPAKCQIVLTEDLVSKEHAWIVPIDEGVVVMDRGSSNGVYVNSLDGPRVSKVKLQHGDKIFIGKGIATFTYQSS
jgi:serine protease Do